MITGKLDSSSTNDDKSNDNDTLAVIRIKIMIH